MIRFLFSSLNFSDPGHLVPLLCTIIAVLGLACIALLVLWHARIIRRRQRLREEYLATTQTANNENQDNLRRYRNPLFTGNTGNDKRGVPNAVPTEELRDLDMEKYDKNPSRFLTDDSSSPDVNAIHDYRRQCKKNNRDTKDINIHLSKMSETEVVV